MSLSMKDVEGIDPEYSAILKFFGLTKFIIEIRSYDSHLVCEHAANIIMIDADHLKLSDICKWL